MCQRIAKTSHQLKKLGRWFQIFLNFHTEPWGNDPIWRAFFSNGLVQPPTRKLFSNYLILGVSLNAGTPKSSIVIGISMINHPFWGTPIFGNTHFRVVINYYKLVPPRQGKTTSLPRIRCLIICRTSCVKPAAQCYMNLWRTLEKTDAPMYGIFNLPLA